MSKAAQIRKLYSAGKTPQEIAGIVGCSATYVRVATHQRANGRNARIYAGRKAYNVSLFQSGDKGKMSQAGREARQSCLAVGGSVADAQRADVSARYRVARATGNRDIARAAYRKLVEASQ